MANNIKKIRSILKKLNYILEREQKIRAIKVLIIIVVGSILELLGVSAILPFVQVVTDPDALMQEKYVMYICEMFNISSSSQLLMILGVALICIYLFKNIYMMYMALVQYDYSTRINMELSIRMLDSFMKRPYEYYLDVNSAQIMRGCTNDTSGVYSIVYNIMAMLSEVFSAAMIAIYLIYTDPTIALTALVLMLVVMFGIVCIFKPIYKRMGNKNLELVTQKNKVIYQITSGIKEIYVTQRKEMFKQEYEEISDVARKVQRRYGALSQFPNRITEGICVSGIIGIVCIRLVMQDAELISFIPKLAMFAMAAFKLFPSIGKLTNHINTIVFQVPAMDSVYQNMYEAEQFFKEQQSFTQENCMENENEQDIRFCENLLISHVSWQYKNQNKPVLTDATLTVKKGQAVGFIGPSGAGKTTLSDIILGLLYPRKGKVLMDGIDVYSMPKRWAQIVGYVPQSVFLLDDNVRNNILFGLQDNGDDEKVWKALEQAQLSEFVKSLPNGLDTVVGERGIKFSGGQRQRIAIARALYSEPEILILDEATAALDNETETAVMEAIEALHGTITMIIVAHRLTTIRKCDVIYEISEGKAVEKNIEEVLRNI